MEQWEYLPTFIKADARDKSMQEFLKAQIPNLEKPPKYMAEAMMPELNRLGEQGWELVHMEPVAGVGKKGDVLFEGGTEWSNTYFCVFKRRRPASPPPSATPPSVPPSSG